MKGLKMIKYNEEMLAHFKSKHLGYMTADAQRLVEVTDRGFVYKGELIVAIEGLKDMIVEKVRVTVGDLESKSAKNADVVVETDLTKTIDEPKKKNDPRVVKTVEERRVFNIDTTPLPPEKVEEYVADLKAKFERKEAPVVVEEVKPAPKRRGPKPKNKTV